MPSSVAFVITSNTITRPADTTAYAVGDLVANSTTAGSVTPFSFASVSDPTISSNTDGSAMVRIDRVRFQTNNTSLTNASFRVHFYRASPTVTNGDNGAWLTAITSYVGAFDMTLDRAFSDGAQGSGVPLVGSGTVITLPATTLYALVEARGAYTPASGQTFNLVIEGYRF